jgi:hypothetical protein
MKKSFIGLLLLLSAPLCAQQHWTSYRPQYARISDARVQILHVERTPQHTIVGLRYQSGNADSTYLQACNSFKLMQNGQSIARLLGVTGVSIDSVLEHGGFECEPKAVGQLIGAGMATTFQLRFTTIPQTITHFDLIEYDGQQACEFDIWGIDLANKMSREIVVQKIVKVQQDTILVEIWDHNQEDGDMITLYLDGEVVLSSYVLVKQKKQIALQLSQGEHLLVMQADNLGSIPPNTAALSLDCGGQKQEIILKSELGKSGSIKIVRQ